MSRLPPAMATRFSIGSCIKSKCLPLRPLQIRYSSSDAPAPPLLLKLRNDLKTAMRAKDTNRLNVVRGILNEVTNSSKTSSPIQTDMQLLSLLRKRAAASETARKEFKDAGRSDLIEKEDAQLHVLQEYAGGVETWNDEQIKEAVSTVIQDMKSSSEKKIVMGDVLKRLFAPGGDLDGKPVEKAKVSVAVKQLLS
ncbi:Yqey-like protein-domain-containing protein [Elsinoe ampelina]|uniref:Altered inheritance of mitochondria protein 41 n=1 Tax=Elsinoe ampelina TaxID=302913 RepID=A0A6A6GE95_9PEZI|nr:Yqey-like protein-domain-containing protein [Elsinoe ampelina]